MGANFFFFPALSGAMMFTRLTRVRGGLGICVEQEGLDGLRR